jgi:hypothetical protein
VSDPLCERWRDAALAAEGPLLRRAAQDAVEAGPSPASVRTLAAACSALSADELGEGLVGLVRWGLESSEADVRWDAVHAAGALALAELEGAVTAALEDSKATTATRARAAEALAVLLEPSAAKARLERVRKDDPDFAVRRLATEAVRRLQSRDQDDGPDLLARISALVRTGRASLEPSGPRVDGRALARAGLRLPASWQLFMVELCAGGRVALGGGALLVESPLTLASRAAQSSRDLSRLHEYVWARYVDGAKTYPQVDEDVALRDYAARYDRGAIDKDAWNYGVLLFESAFRDEARRDEYLLRCRHVLRAYRDHVDEEWDVVDDRLAEAEDMVAEDGLRLLPGDSPAAPVGVGSWEGIQEILLDLDRPGVFARDPDGGEVWRVATCPLLFLNDPHVDRPGDTRLADVDAAEDALGQLRQAEEAFVAGRLKAAGRLFGDALEADRSKSVLSRAAAFLERDDLSPLMAAQLLATIPMEGDKTSLDVVRVALQAVDAERALALVEALAPHNEPQGPVALFVDAAAAIRKKTHAPVRERARKLKGERGHAHIRTMRNPWYK